MNQQWLYLILKLEWDYVMNVKMNSCSYCQDGSFEDVSIGISNIVKCDHCNGSGVCKCNECIEDQK